MRRGTAWWAAAIALAIAAAGAAWWWGRGEEDDEARIRRLVDGAAAAVASRDVNGVVAPLSERFRGHGLDRHGAKQLVALEVLRGAWVSATVAGATVAVDGERAAAQVDAVLARAAGRGKALAELLPGEGSAHRFALRLEREGDGWRVVEAAWRPITLAEALAGPPPAELAPAPDR
ncbi:hypothetical protein ACOQFB_00740 [Anaeromyxobacter sp. Red801]|uniref:hypothetical protein n=1 Tax=Anaeromyxobacter sp. Red801 TaxID=3411632 RepID=UPI003BA2379E